MKLGDFFNVTKNKKTNQESWHLKLKSIKKEGFTSKELLEMTIPKSQIKQVLEVRRQEKSQNKEQKEDKE